VTSEKRGGASTKLVFLAANCTPVRSEIADKSLSHSCLNCTITPQGFPLGG